MTTDQPDAPQPEDPILEARIQHALKPYAHMLTPAALAEARRTLTLVLTTHPVAVRLMNRLRERSTPGSSGVAPTSAGAAVTEEPKRPAQGNKMKRRGPR